jgi:hypothetical protein
MAKQICSSCGYEGRGKPAGGRKGGGLFRVLGILTLLPFYSIWQLCGGSGGRQCPHCSLPAMVKLNSAEGIIARRKLDAELGLIQVKKPEEKDQAETFGNDKPAETPRVKKPVNPDEW